MLDRSGEATYSTRAMSSSAPTPVPEPVFEPHSFGGYLQVGALEGVTFLPRALARIIDLFTHYAIFLIAPESFLESFT